MTRDEAIERGLKAGTMLDAEQLGCLWALAEMAPDGPAVEVGVWKGGSVICWSSAREGRGRVIGVDNWFGVEDSPVRERCLGNFREAGIDVEVIDSNGWDAPPLIGESIAFCFIDSDHGIAGIPRELGAWPPVIMPGGILALHDWGVWKPQVVVQACAEAWQASAHWEDLGLVGSTKAYRRPFGGDA